VNDVIPENRLVEEADSLYALEDSIDMIALNMMII
jgi:hypothetical protein